MTSVHVESLVVSYGATRVLNGVEVEIGDGEFFFLLGPSGCGKTTLLRSIAGFVEPSAGRIRFGERSMTGVPPAKRDCGMVFQNYALWPHMTVFQNVAFGLDVRKVEKVEKERRVRQALALVQMEKFAERPPNRLSGGQQQRVALARALVVDPQVLLLDEPLSNLDAALRVELRGEIRDIQRRTGRTAVYVTHDRAEALALADRIAVLRDGRIEQLGTPEDLYERPVNPFVAGFVGDANRIEGRAAGAEAGGVVVEGPFGRVAARATGGAVAAGEDAFLVVRPERVRLVAGGDASPRDDVNVLPGTVERRTFLGEMVQYDVRLAGGTSLKTLSIGFGRMLEEGQVVHAHVDDALVFRASPTPRTLRQTVITPLPARRTE